MAVAKIYNDSSNFQKDCGLELIEHIGQTLSSCNKVLDLGCGTGYLASVMAEKLVTGTILGVDPDKDRIELAQNNYSDIKNLQFIEGNHETFPDDKYDLIFSNIVLHWIEDKDVLFERVSKCLKSGGQFVFSVTPSMPSLFWQLTDLTIVTMGPEKQPKFSFATSDEYKQLAADYSFIVSMFDDKKITYQWKNIDDVLNWWMGVTHGKFDPAAVDPKVLETLKKPYGKEPVSFTPSCYFFILTKQ